MTSFSDRMYLMFPYLWKLSDNYKGVEKHGKKVFSTFSCGGGSTMGYKLAGYDVLGSNDIDPKMMEIYVANHHPKYSFVESITTFKDRDDLPQELYDLDILDGSPPCSSFSIAGNREDDWGKEKKFREGQQKQVLDTLFFDFIDLAKRLQPKVVIAENVKGLLIGEAKEYVNKIYAAFEEAGYYLNHYLLDASEMGVPQRRERVFFIAIRKDIANAKRELFGDLFAQTPTLNMAFYEREIKYGEVEEKEGNQSAYGIYPGVLKYWKLIEPGRSCADAHPKGHYFQEMKLTPNRVLPTIRAGSNSYYHYEVERKLFDNEIIKAGSFPLDFNFCKSKPIYVVGMSVPPVMMAQVAKRVYEQVLK
jgi:DNA (cytosine-5)-methyltransferase 1